jgi:hypothetical protein
MWPTKKRIRALVREELSVHWLERRQTLARQAESLGWGDGSDGATRPAEECSGCAETPAEKTLDNLAPVNDDEIRI